MHIARTIYKILVKVDSLKFYQKTFNELIQDISRKHINYAE